MTRIFWYKDRIIGRVFQVAATGGWRKFPPSGGESEILLGRIVLLGECRGGNFSRWGDEQIFGWWRDSPPSPSSRENLDRGKFTAYSLLDNSTARWISKISDTNCS